MEPAPSASRAPTSTFGPDAFGYRGFDGAEPQCSFQFVDIATTGTNVITGDDEGLPVTLPGPAFNFYGQTFTQLAATTNGYLSTLASDDGPDLSNDCPLPAVPSTGGGGRIYPLHDDLEAIAANGGGVLFQYFPACPRPSGWGGAEGCYVFQWNRVNHFGNAANQFTFQAILYTTSFGIVFQHLPGNPELGSGSTTGLQNASSTIGLNYACNTANSIGTNTSNRAQCIYHPSFPFGAGVTGDLTLSLTDSPDPVTPGNNITYVATSTNNGPNSVSNVNISVPLAAGTTFVSATASAGGTCTTPAVGANGTVSCTFAGNTANGGTHSATVVAAVPASTVPGTSFTVNATTSSTPPDSNVTNNGASATTTVGAGQANLAAGLTDSPDPVVAGTNVTYTATVSNAGPSDAQNAQTSLALPANATFVSANAPGGTCTGTTTVVCVWSGATAPGTTRTATVVALVAPSASGSISATNTVSATTADPVLNNNEVLATTSVDTQADLTATIGDSPDPVIAGTNLSYAVSLTNGGPSDAQNAQLSLPLPAGTSLVSATGTNATCTGTTTVVCVWPGATAPTVTRNATITVLVAPSVANNSVLTATVAASSPTADITPGNNSASTTTTVNTQANLAAGLSDTPDPVTAGTNLTYSATLNNIGPSDAQNAQVSLPLPAGTTFVSSNAPGGTCSGTTTVVCVWNGATAPGVTRTATIVALVGSGVTNGTILTATNTVSSPTNDTVIGNNTASTTTTVSVSANLALTLTASTLDTPLNSSVSFTAVSTNLGPSDAVNLSTSLVLSPDFRFGTVTAAGATCTTPQIGLTGTITCTWAGATLPNAARTMVVTAVAVVDGISTISASTVSETSDPVTTNNSASLSMRAGLPYAAIPVNQPLSLILMALLLGGLGLAMVRRQS